MTVVERKEKRIRDVKRLTKNGFDAWIGALARAAVFDTLPPLTGEVARKLHLFWPRLPAHEVALSLIKRTPALQKESVEHGGLMDFAVEIAPVVMLHSRKARNKHVNQLRDIFFTPESKSQFAHNVLADQLIDGNGTVRPMKLTDAVGHLTTVDALCDLLKSSDLHADRVVYPLFVMGLAAGKLSKIRKQPDSVPLAQFINVNYEAHFRAEMWFSLNKQGIRLSNHHDHIIIIITLLPHHHHDHIIICKLTCHVFVFVTGFRHECTDAGLALRAKVISPMLFETHNYCTHSSLTPLACFADICGDASPRPPGQARS